MADRIAAGARRTFEAATIFIEEDGAADQGYGYGNANPGKVEVLSRCFQPFSP